MPIFFLGLLAGSGATWFVSDAGDKLAKTLLVGAGLYVAWKYRDEIKGALK